MPASEIKKRWKNGEVVYSIAIKLGSPFLVEVAAFTGFDVIKIDLEHGLNWLHQLPQLVQAVNGTKATTIAKIPPLDPESRRQLIGTVLDLGVEGVVLAQTDDREGAEYGVACTRHTPAGIRGAGNLYLKYLPGGKSREIICIAEIDNPTGVKNAKEIISTTGIDGVTIGVSDLAASLGVESGPQSADRFSHSLQEGAHADTAEQIMRICKDNGAIWGCTNDEGEEERKRLLGLGCQLMNLGSDMSFFERGMEYAKSVLASR